MAEGHIDVGKCRILISNDDGVESPGIKILEKVARKLTDDVWVVAPEVEQSGASHSLTIGRPLRIRRMGDRHFAIDGTPKSRARATTKKSAAKRSRRTTRGKATPKRKTARTGGRRTRAA